MVLLLMLFTALLHAQMPESPQPVQAEGRLQGSLPFEKLGPNDLIGVFIYDAPEISGKVRVNAAGSVSLPLLPHEVKVSGLYPTQAASAIQEALRAGNVLVNPVVSISVLEYRSRQITVVGAVHKPLTLQQTGTMRLLDALSLCEGLSAEAGPEILITRALSETDEKKGAEVQRVPVKALLEGKNPALNLLLEGGEEIRVPSAGKVYVVGNIKKPGAFAVQDAEQSSVLRALALSEGLLPYASPVAYIYRRGESPSARIEIPVELKKIIDRKLPDVSLQTEDIFYVPDRAGRRNLAMAMEKLLAIGGGLSTAAVYAAR